MKPTKFILHLYISEVIYNFALSPTLVMFNNFET